MSITVNNLSSFYYNTYALSNSDTYKENAVDSSDVAKESYNVANLTNAFDALANSDTVDFNMIGNVDSYAKNIYTISQLDVYDTLTSATSVSDILSNNSDLSGLYEFLGANDLVSKDYYEAVLDEDAGTDTTTESQSYSDYLDDNTSGSVFDTLA